MFFELTDSITDDIVFSMEDQGGEWYFDSINKTVASREMMEEVGSELDLDSDDFYSIPQWTSEDGFELMEDFTENLHTPGAKTDLRRALSGGRGVFRNFKNVLKQYPEVEQRWFLFKNDKMCSKVLEWYNSLRESWGLEKLAEEDSDKVQETDELLLNDFIYGEYDSQSDWTDIRSGLTGLMENDTDLERAELFLLQNHSNLSKPEEKSGLVCRSQDSDFVGCLLITNCPSCSEKTVVVTDFFVIQNHRGLGIGRLLLSKCLEELKDRGVHFCYVSGMLVPETFRLTFEQFGFKKNGPGFITDLSV